MEPITGKNTARRVIVQTLRHDEAGAFEAFHAETREGAGWHRSSEGGGPKTRAEAQAWCDEMDD